MDFAGGDGGESERQVAHFRGQTSEDHLPSKDVNVRKYGRKKLSSMIDDFLK